MGALILIRFGNCQMEFHKAVYAFIIAVSNTFESRTLRTGRSPAVVRLSIDRIETNIESIESKITKIFKRPKNREDGSDFDDFLTESIVSPWSIFQKFCERPKNYRIDRIDRLDRATARSIESIAGRRQKDSPAVVKCIHCLDCDVHSRFHMTMPLITKTK